jgi:predicted AAA+ superfamily ATPase
VEKSKKTKPKFPKLINIGKFGEICISLQHENFAYEYLQTVFQNIYENDILKRYTIYNETSYREVIDFLIDNISSSNSARNIAGVLTANGKKIDHKTVSKYIDTLVESYLFYKVNRYDIKGKQHLSTQEKYYLVDLGLRNALLGKETASDRGHLLENIIYLELQRRNYQIWIGKTDNLEVDFIARNKNGYTNSLATKNSFSVIAILPVLQFKPFTSTQKKSAFCDNLKSKPQAILVVSVNS